MRSLIATLAVVETPLMAAFVGIGLTSGDWRYALGAGVGIAGIAVVIGTVVAVQFMRGAR